MKRNIRILFMGTPAFAVHSLKALLDNDFEVAAVVTAPDKPAGRGLKLMQSPVKEFAVEKNLTILQPTNLKSAEFTAQLDAINANLYIVVAFRMLPQSVWSKAEYGTFNLHASLLPDYRGAAPINRAIMNGEKETGVSTFFLNDQIDTGKIIFQEKTTIDGTDTAGLLHDKLMEVGGQLVVKTAKAIQSNDYSLIDQSTFTNSQLKPAPKLFKDDCKINWNNSSNDVYNHIRGLNPYPGAWSELIHKENEKVINFKVYDCSIEKQSSPLPFGSILTDNKSYFNVSTSQGLIHIKEVKLAGKRKMHVEELLRGFNLDEYRINL